jgi:hypothetical protein
MGFVNNIFTDSLIFCDFKSFCLEKWLGSGNLFLIVKKTDWLILENRKKEQAKIYLRVSSRFIFKVVPHDAADSPKDI